MTQKQWQRELRTELERYSALSSLSFRASCLDGWADQYVGEGADYPSLKARADYLLSLGYRALSRYKPGTKEMERVYFRGEDHPAKVKVTVVYYEGRWHLEDELFEANPRLESLHYRKEASRRFAELLRSRRRRQRVNQRLELERIQRANVARLAAIAEEQIRALLISRQKYGCRQKPPKNFDKAPSVLSMSLAGARRKAGKDGYRVNRRVKGVGSRTLRQEEFIERKVKLAMGRWRRHLRDTGEAMSIEAALERKPIKNRHYQRAGVSTKRNKRLVSEALKDALPVLEAVVVDNQTVGEAEVVVDNQTVEIVDNQPEIGPENEYQAPSVLSWPDDEPKNGLTSYSSYY